MLKKAAPAKKVAPAKKAAPAGRPKAAKKRKRTPWLDNRTETPLIDRYARRMKSFVDAIADGVIEAHEIKEQEVRLVGLMKDVEPQLEDRLHEKVTLLLCELAVYDIMQMLHMMQETQPAPRFRG